MRWQKTARLAIASFVIVFAAVVFVALRRPTPAKTPESTPREDLAAIAETRRTPGAEAPVYRSITPEGAVRYQISYDKLTSYADGRHVFVNATITLPERNGRTVHITGGEVQALVPQNRADPVDTIRLTRGVKLVASDGLEVTSDNAVYDEKTGVLSAPGQVQFKKGRVTGSGVGATYDRERNVLALLAQASMTVAPDEHGKGRAEATAGSATLSRADHTVKLVTSAHVAGDDRQLNADEITVQLSDDDRLIQSMALRGHSRIAGTPGSGGAEGMSARDIDLLYAPDGRTLQQAKLIENAVARLAGAAGGGARQVSGRTIDITMGPDGATVNGLIASENVQVDLPADGDVPARRINAAQLMAGGATGLQTATFTGGVTYRELRPGQGGAAPSERTGRSQRLVIDTEPGLGEVQRADFGGSVHIADGATTADGQRAIYQVAKDTFDLVPAPELPGPAPSVNDGRVLVGARTITFGIATRKLSADGSVRSSLQPSKDEPASAAKGGAPAGTGKLPSMLERGQVVHVTSNHLEYDGAAGQATYTGDARLWQDKTTIKGDTIVVDDKQGNLTAIGRVRTVMFFEEADAKSKTRKLVQMDGTGDRMVYDDAKRVATYTTGETGQAHIVGTQGDVVADRIDLFLRKAVNELERAEAAGHVVVKEGGRIAKGNHLTYTAADETYVMHGTPLEVEERTPECRVTLCAKLTFKRNTEENHIEGTGLIPVTTRSCTPK